MVEVAQGEVWWAELPEPPGSGPGLRRPVVVVQGNSLNRSRISTVVCVPMTSNLAWADAPGNVLLPATATGLPKDSVANASQIVALDRRTLVDRVRPLPDRWVALIVRGVDIVLGR
ncbi:MAG: type II toxin-antitoxin system PemK/MazF family toxin [Spirochaetaceae bacterium]|nr:type II toxin-antitoxin system PemK/MazF family toxin [Spirochaetaceae bacterium]